MMQVYWWLLSFLVIVRAVSHLEQQWHSWKQQHGKVYMDIKEEHTRRDIWMENLDKIRKFNNRAPTGNFTLAINQFTDLVSYVLSQPSSCSVTPHLFQNKIALYRYVRSQCKVHCSTKVQ